MQNQMLLVSMILASVLTGAMLCWMVTRRQIVNAIQQGKSDALVEIATMQERLRSALEEAMHLRTAEERLQQTVERSRAELEAANHQNAQLSERANRIPVIETGLAAAVETEKSLRQEILRLSTSEAENLQELQLTRRRLNDVVAELAEARNGLAQAAASRNELAEKNATLETVADRVEPLERKLAERDATVEALHLTVAGLKEASGRLESNLDAATQAAEAADHRHRQLAARLDVAERELVTTRQHSGELQAVASSLRTELNAREMALAETQQRLGTEQGLHREAGAEVQRLSTALATAQAELESERNQNAEKIALLAAAREELSLAFKNLANEILEEKSKRFSEDNRESLGQLLNPLRDRMAEFRTKVEEIHAKEIEQQAMLRAELGQLKDLNRQMTEEAHGLATALKGQAKTQGNWGELVLGNVLDRAGLCEGKDFRREVSFNTEEGRQRPDVIVSLPQNKHLVIDAKVSLNAYTRYVNAEDDLVRSQALKEHVQAVSNRIQELSDRNYFALPGLNTPEMVFMFIPVESAFVEALRADESLFMRAVANNILVATPTTLLTSLNIVRQLWRFEEQNSHTAELAERASKVYKKLVSFLASMETVGSQLDRAKDAYSKAMGQLVHGRANLIQQVHDFERLGVSIPGGRIPEQLVEKALLELDASDASVTDSEVSAPVAS